METMNIEKLACEVFDIEANAILRLKNSLGVSFDRAINLLYGCKGRVIVTGMGKSGLIGKKIAATLSSTGTPAYFLHPAESTHGDSGIITRDDVVIAISNSGETQELLNLLPVIKRFGVPIISMTGRMDSTLAKAGEAVLDISVEKEACPLGKAPTASTTATLAMGDALAVCLLQKRGFTAEDFLVFHPGGALGKGIKYHVSDLMMTESRQMPVASEDIEFTELVKIISEYKLGMAMLTDKSGRLSGILTDGDIRRIVLKYQDLTNLSAKEVMSVNPKTVQSSDFAASALHLMEKYSITALAVVDDDNCPVGVVHIHDILKAGVV